MEPVATYREKRFDGQRRFELFADRVLVRGNVSLKSEFETAVPLRSLAPHVTRPRLRNPAFWGGLWTLLGSVFLCAVLVGFNAPDFPLVLAGTGVLSGSALMLATARKVEFASFSSGAGVRVLDVARSGPDARRFDAFVESPAWPHR